MSSAEFGNDEGGFVMDTSETTIADLGSGGTIDKEGWYHLAIEEVTADLSGLNKRGEACAPHIVFEMQVVIADPKLSPAGKKHYHRLYVGAKGGGPPADGAKKSALRFGLGLGILKETPDGKIVDAATGEPRITIDTWRRAKHCQCVAQIKKEDAKEGSAYGDRFQIPFGRVYIPTAPECKDIRVCRDSLEQAANASLFDLSTTTSADPDGLDEL